jgi:hypothetical protein
LFLACPESRQKLPAGFKIKKMKKKLLLFLVFILLLFGFFSGTNKIVLADEGDECSPPGGCAGVCGPCMICNGSGHCAKDFASCNWGVTCCNTADGCDYGNCGDCRKCDVNLVCQWDFDSCRRPPKTWQDCFCERYPNDPNCVEPTPTPVPILTPTPTPTLVPGEPTPTPTPFSCGAKDEECCRDANGWYCHPPWAPQTKVTDPTYCRCGQAALSTCTIILRDIPKNYVQVLAILFQGNLANFRYEIIIDDRVFKEFTTDADGKYTDTLMPTPEGVTVFVRSKDNTDQCAAVFSRAAIACDACGCLPHPPAGVDPKVACPDCNSECESCITPGQTFLYGGCWTALGCLNPGEPQGFVAWILRFAIGIGGGIALLLIIGGSLMIITSGGDPEKVKIGREMIVSAISGLLLIIFSLFFFQLVAAKLLQLPGFGF